MDTSNFLFSGEQLTEESIIDKTYRHSRGGGNPGKKTGFLVKPGMTKQGECLYNYGLISKCLGNHNRVKGLIQ